MYGGVSKGMCPVRHLPPKFLLAVAYCRHQLASSCFWETSANHRNKGVIPHPGELNRSLQYDGCLNWCFGAGWDVEYRQSECKN